MNLHLAPNEYSLWVRNKSRLAARNVGRGKGAKFGIGSDFAPSRCGLVPTVRAFAKGKPARPITHGEIIL
jgi:hypothetical protein